MLHTGDKANAKKIFDKQCKIQFADNNWVPDKLIMNRMFIIYTNPILYTRMADYVHFLLVR